jgi:hypothetical protein
MAIPGLRVRNPNTGAVYFEVSDRATRIVGTLTVGAGSGSFTVPVSAGDEVWAVQQLREILLGQADSKNLTVSGNVISWGAGPAATLTYGVY